MAVEDMLRGVQLGASIASDRLNRNLREQELRSEQALRRIQERQSVMELDLMLKQQNMATQYRADAEKAMRQTMIETSPVLPAPGSPMGVIPNPAQQPLERALLKNLGPVIGQYEPGKLPAFVQDMAMMPFKRQAQQGISPSVQTFTDQTTGRKVTMAQTGPNSWSIVQPEKADVPLSTFGKLQSDLRSAIQRGDTEGAQQLRAKIDAEASGKGMSIRTNPDGTVEILQGGAQGAKLPSSTVGEAEKVANSASNFINTGRELIALAKAPNVGVIGNVKRLSTRIVGQLAGEDMIQAGEEFDFAQAATFFRGAATRILKSDSQITEDERKSIIAALPSGGWLEAPTTVKRQAESAIQKVAESARRQIQRAGVAMPTELMTPDEIAQAFNEGRLKISEDEAVQLMVNSIFNQ